MKQVCYGIVGKTRFWMSEYCVSLKPENLEDELEEAQDSSPEEDYKIVPLYILESAGANDG